MAPLQAQLAAQGAENSQLRSRMVALEAGEGGEEGGRRVRQRVGAAPHDAPPSTAEVRAMDVAAAAAALRAHVSVSRVAAAACMRLFDLCMEDQNEQVAAEAGAIEAIVAALQAHPQVAGVQQSGCRALFNMCFGSDAAARARRQGAVTAGATEAVAGAMQAHPGDAAVQRRGQHLRDLLA